MSLTAQELLHQERDICDLHAKRLSAALHELEPVFPLTRKYYEAIELPTLALLELMMSRFAKLQDTMGQRVFPLLLEAKGEDIAQKSFIDRLNLLERLGILKDQEEWMRFRELRNFVAHEYPDKMDLLVENINRAQKASWRLLEVWSNMRNLA